MAKDRGVMHPGLLEGVWWGGVRLGKLKVSWGSAHQGVLAFKGIHKEPIEVQGSVPLFCLGAEVESAFSASQVPLFGFHGNLCLWGNRRHQGCRQMLLIPVPRQLQNAPWGGRAE